MAPRCGAIVVADSTGAANRFSMFEARSCSTLAQCSQIFLSVASSTRASRYSGEMTEQPEVWLRGRIDGYEPLLMPAVHALLQVREDIERLRAKVPGDHAWSRPGGAASIGFHVRHTAGALDRLLTYARGVSLDEGQLSALRHEEEPGDPPARFEHVADEAIAMVDRALAQIRATSAAELLEDRRVGRAGLPSNVIGLLFHAAEHSTRHIGQAITTARILAARST